MDKQQIDKEEEKDGKVNWVDLPANLLALITDKLFFVKDYIRFGAVCRPWRSVYTDSLDQYCRPRRLPLLMVPGSEEDGGETRSLYSLSDNAVIPNIKLPVSNSRFCLGSSDGWLATLNQYNDMDLRLQHPFSGAEIKLPSTFELFQQRLGSFGRDFVYKVIFSANPSSNPNYVVMVIYSDQCRLALFRPGNPNWNSFGEPTWTPLDISFTDMHDVIYWRDRFYAVDFQGQIYACDPHHPNPQLVKVAQPPPFNLACKKKYVVVSNEDLWVIARSRNFDSSKEYYRTCSFEVFKLKLGSSRTTWKTWIRLKSLGGRALFLGANSSRSFLASDFPGCRPDCIYFTDDFKWFYRDGDRAHVRGDRAPIRRCCNLDFGLYNLAEGTFDQLFPVKSKFIVPNPIWIQQTLPKQQHYHN